VGIAAARALIGRDWSDAAELLAERTIYVIPELNPDGAGWLNGHLAGARVELGRTVSPFDADRDRRIGEDPPNDINGDGLITQMRVRNPPVQYGLVADLVIDDDDERLLRPAKPEKGERGEWALLTEGLDDDGDGAFNEDGSGGPGSGVDLDRNFPAHWPEFEEGAGLIQLSEPENLSLVRWMLDHRNIVGVLVFGPGDSLINKPPTGQYDETGRMPKGIEKTDKEYFDHVAETYAECVSLESAPQPGYEGSLLAWAYADYGAWAFQSAVWSRPKVEKEAEENAAAPEAPSPEPAEPQAPSRADEMQALIDQGVPEAIATFLTASLEERQAIASEFENASEEERAEMMAMVRDLPPDVQARVMAAVQETAGGVEANASSASPDPAPPAGKRGQSSSDDGKWLSYSDSQRNGEGFVEWTPVEHPQLGTVEVGGFVPGFRLNPPPEQVDALAEAEAAFVVKLLGMLPSVELAEPRVESLSDNVWRVSIELFNPGYLPTSSAVGLKIRQPIAVEIEIDIDRVLSGDRVTVIDRLLGSSEPTRISWLIRAQPGEQIPLHVRSERFGQRSVVVTMEGARP
ncbi:MAG: hypothetical protein D6695_04705, partial [Planctomycetota bacterium]